MDANTELVRLLSLMLLLLLSSGRAASAKQNTKTHTKMIARIDIWNPYIAWTTPIYSLYDDGTVIFAKTNDLLDPPPDVKPPEYFTCKLNPFSLQRDRSLFSGLEHVSSFYSLTDATDRPQTSFGYRNSNSTIKGVAVYGAIRQDNKQKLSPILIDLYDKFARFDNPKATRWLPDRIQLVSVESQEPHSGTWPPEVSLPWPEEFPHLASKNAFLTKSQFLKFEQLSARADRFYDQGKWWSVSYRFPVPDQESWSIPGERK
jgi:hypothetical protein